MVLWILRLIFGGWLRSALKFAAAHFRETLIVVLLAFSAWAYRGWTAEAESRHSDAGAFQAATQQAKDQQVAMRARELAKAKEDKDRADREITEGHQAVLDATARHRADLQRLRAAHPGCAPAVVFREADPAGLRTEVPADPVLAEADAAVSGWSSAAEYAVRLRDWALSVTRNK